MNIATKTDWYERRHELEPGMVFRCHDGSVVKLNHRVPGDGTDWRVASFYGGQWHYEESRIHPGDLNKLLTDPNPTG